jgi:hypothetical protein
MVVSFLNPYIELDDIFQDFGTREILDESILMVLNCIHEPDQIVTLPI